MRRVLGVTTAAVLAMAVSASAAGFTFERALGFAQPSPLDCTALNGCVPGAPGSLAGQLESPSATVVVGEEVFVADSSNHRISVFNAATGAFVRAFGEDVGGSGVNTCTVTCRAGRAGDENGAFNRPTGIAADGDDLYVADRGNNRIAVVTTAGVFQRVIGTGGSGAGQLDGPTAVTVSGGKVYVADTGNQRIGIFTTAGVFVRALGLTDPQVLNCTAPCFGGAPLPMAAGLSYPTATAASGGEVFVADPGNNRIDVFTTAGVFVRAFGANVDGAGGAVCTTSCQAGEGSGDAGHIRDPRGLAIADGLVYIASGAQRVDVFTTAGAFVRAFGKGVDPENGSDVCTTTCWYGQSGAGAGELREPRGIAVSGGKVYVTEGDNDRVSVFTTAGVFERAFGKDVGGPGVDVCTTTCEGDHAGSGAGELNAPYGVAVDGGEVYVTDFFNSRISVFTTAGAFVRTFGRNVDGLGGGVCTSGCRSGDWGSGAVGEIRNPYGVVVAGGEVYVTDLTNRRIAVFTTAGAFQRAFGGDVGGSGVAVCTTTCARGSEGGAAGQMRSPAGLALDGGTLFAADRENHRVAAFGTAGGFERAFGARLAPACTTTCARAQYGKDAGQLQDPSAVAVAGGRVFVSDSENHRISAFDTATGAFVLAFGDDVGGSGSDVCTSTCGKGRYSDTAGALRRPWGLAVDGTDLYVTEHDSVRVSVFDTATGAFERAFGKDVGGSGVDTCATTCQSGSVGGGAGQLSRPLGATLADGKLYLAESGNHRISVFTAATGAFSHALGLTMTPGCTTVCGTGLAGGAAGQLSVPGGAAVSGGEVFVADSDNHRISVFDAETGAFVRAFGRDVDGAGGDVCTTSCQAGTYGSAAGRLFIPGAVAIAGGEVYVVEIVNRRISVFTPAGVFVRAFGKGVNADDGSDVCTTSCQEGGWGTGAGQLRDPSGIAVSDGKVYVTEAANHRVSVFSTAGVFERAFGKDVGGPGVDVCTTTCEGNHAGDGAGELNAPYGVAVGGGEVYVTDFYNSRVNVFTTSGTFVRTFGRNVDGLGGGVCTSSCRHGDYGSGAVGEIQNPYGVVVAGGEVYVADASNQRIAVFSTAGAFQYAFGRDVGGSGLDVCTTSCQPGVRGGGAGELQEPTGIALSGGDLFVAEQGANRVSKLGGGAPADTEAPVTSDDVPSSGYRTGPVTVTLSASDGGGSGVAGTYYTTGASPAAPTTASAQYDPAAKPVLGDGERIRYFSVDGAGNAEAARASSVVHIDAVAPVTTDDVPSADVSGAVTVTLGAVDSGGSGVAATYYTTGASPAQPTTSSAQYSPAAKPTLGDGEKIRYFSVDAAGNAETPHSSGAVRVATSGGGASGSAGSSGSAGGPVGEDSSSGGGPGSGGSGGAGGGSEPGPANPCAGRRGEALLTCRAYLDYKAFMAKCDTLTGVTHRRSCVKRATRAYRQALDLVECRRLTGNARKRCERKARGARTVGSQSLRRVTRPSPRALPRGT